jgi:error-prone DNA polymerase
VDILYSDWESVLETPDYQWEKPTHQPAIRLGLQRIKGFNEAAALGIMHARNEQPFCSVEDAARRARLDRGQMSRLTEGGALKGLAGHRYQTHWDVLGIPPPSPLLDQVAEPTPQWTTNNRSRIELLPPSETDDIRADYTSLGLTLGRHPMAILREREPFRQCKSAEQLQSLNHGRFVQVAGIVTGRQRPSSAAGVIFLTLEDETNNINVVIWQKVLERFRVAIVQGKLLKIKGVMERQDSVIHVIAGHVENCSSHLSSFLLKSRDFH